MKQKTKIHFIINPISGKGKNTLDNRLLNDIFSDQEFDIVLKKSTQKHQAFQLATASVQNKADIVVACGGDGTINEVASALVGTSIQLGILRLGSGNGLAANLKIPKNVSDAMKVIKEAHTTKIDVGQLNDYYFFSNTSLGFGAKLIQYYNQTKQRQLLSYILAFFKASLYNRPSFARLEFNAQQLKIKPLILFISNSNEMGYNLSLTPKASLQDGKLDLLYVDNIGFWKKLLLIKSVLSKKIHQNKYAKHYTLEELHVRFSNTQTPLIQIDGETVNLDTNWIRIRIKKSALSVITPESY